MSKNLHIACSPLTGTIFAGKVLKKCVWAQGKQDLTIEALFAVAEHVTHFGKPVELSDTSGKLLFKIFVDRPAEKQFMTQKSEPSATEPMGRKDCLAELQKLEAQLAAANGESDALKTELAEKQKHILVLEDRMAEMKSALKLALEYWENRLKRYKNRSPVWVKEAKEALKEPAYEG